MWIGGGLSALGAVGTAFVLLARTYVHVEKALPVLIEISEEFQPDSGKSLSDRVQAMQGDLAKVKVDVDHTRKRIDYYHGGEIK